MKLLQSFKNNVSIAAEVIGLKEPSTRIKRTGDLHGVDTPIGDYVFETTKYMFEVSDHEPDQDYLCNVSFSDDKNDYLDSEKRPSISIESDKVSEPQDYMKWFTRKKVLDHPYIFEVVNFWREPRLVNGKNVFGKWYHIYRFKHNGITKNLTLCLPQMSDLEERSYAEHAWDMIAVSLKIA